MDSEKKRWLQFSGEEDDFAYWKEKFEGYLHGKKLRQMLLEEVDATDAQKYTIWAELIQCLDKRSVMMLRAECKGDGIAAWQQLCAHFSSTETPRIMNLFSQFTSLSLKSNEDMMDYLIRAETLSSSLEVAGEKVSEPLLVSVVLKGLPNSYDYFKTVHDFSKTKTSFSDVKKALINFSDSQKIRKHVTEATESCALFTGTKPKDRSSNQQGKFVGKCFSCGKLGHKSNSCRSKKCDFCGKPGHTSEKCWKRTGNNGNKETSNFAKEFSFMTSEKCFNIVASQEFVLDSGCTSHMFKDRSLFVDFVKSVSTSSCVNANNSHSAIEGKGTVKIRLKDSTGAIQVVCLKDCLFVPSHSRNLLSVSSFTSRGAKIFFHGSCNIVCKDGTKFPFWLQNGLFLIEGFAIQEALSVTPSGGSRQCSPMSDSNLWHKRLGHKGFSDFEIFRKSVLGFNVVSDLGAKTSDCDVCSLSKAHKQPRSREPEPRRSHVLDLVYSDVMGPVETPSFGGHKYAICFVDSHSRYAWVFFMQSKDEAFVKFKRFCAEQGNPKVLRSDNGREYKNKSFDDFCDQKGIKHEYTTPYSPHQNGVAERRWRTTVEMARSMLKSANLAKSFWVRALDVAFYLTNRVLTSSLPKGKTPFQMFFGKKPDISHLKIFGCSGYRLIETATQKLDDKAKLEVFVGYGATNGSFYMFNPETERISLSRNVTFLENQRPGVGATDNDPILDSAIEQAEINDIAESVPEEVPEAEEPADENPSILRSARNRKTPDFFGCRVDSIEEALLGMVSENDTGIPQSHGDVLASPEKDKWIEAMESEHRSLLENNTWDLSRLPPNRKALGSRWVFAVKRGPDGEIIKFKARFVAKGFAQTCGEDYFETFAPTAKFDSIRVCLSIAVQLSATIFQLDVKSAYLNASVSEEIYLSPPPMFESRDQNGNLLYCKLNKSLYGLKQAGREWNIELNNWLISFGLSRSKIDPCCYVMDKGDSKLVVVVWVDDVLFFSSPDSLSYSFKKQFASRYKVDDKGKMEWFLGISVVQLRGEIVLSQSKYVQDLLSDFSMSDCKPRNLPAVPNYNLSKGSSEEPELLSEEDHALYRSIVGKINYLSVVTRPDLAFIVSSLSQYLSKPTAEHLVAAKHVLRYLKGTVNFSLTLRKSESFELIGYCDSDWAADAGDRRSFTGYCFKLGSESDVLSWCTRKQPTVALSSMEAEYMSMSAASQHVVFLRSLLHSLGFGLSGPSIIHADNQGAILLAQNPIGNRRSKHIDVRHHYVRELVEGNTIHLSYIPTEENISDSLTKNLGTEKFKKFRAKMLTTTAAIIEGAC